MITHVFLFNGPELLARLQRRGVKIGGGTSVIRAYWDEAEIYPVQRNRTLPLSEGQVEMLRWFSDKA